MQRSLQRRIAAIPKNMTNFINSPVFLVNKFGFRSPPGSDAPDLGMISIETEDPANTMKEFATSNHPWATNFREYAKKAFGIDFSGPPSPLNEIIVEQDNNTSESASDASDTNQSLSGLLSRMN